MVPQVGRDTPHKIALSLAMATSETWLRLCLLAWHAQAGTHGLVLAFLEQCAAADCCARCGHVIAAWRLVLHRNRFLHVAWSLLEMASRHAAPLTRVAFR